MLHKSILRISDHKQKMNFQCNSIFTMRLSNVSPSLSAFQLLRIENQKKKK